MARVHVDSLLRVELPFVDLEWDGDAFEAPLDGSESVELTKPDGTQTTLTSGAGLTVTSADDGETYWEGTVDQVGIWRWQGIYQASRSKPVTVRVWPNP